MYSKNTSKNTISWHVIKNHKMRRKEPFSKNMFGICMIVLLFHKSVTSMITSRLAVLARSIFLRPPIFDESFMSFKTKTSLDVQIFHQDENGER